MPFSDYKLKPFILETLKSKNFMEPTKIQEKVIPLILENKSVIGKSMTGSGKTHAFLIPIINQIDTESDQINGLIIAPTRELCYQIYKMAQEFKKYNSNLRIEMISGGQEKKKKINDLKRKPHLLIATPGRILDLIEKENVLNLSKIKFLVLDEFDMIMENCFNEDLFRIFKVLNPQRTTHAFSATLNKNIKYIFKRNMKDSVVVDINPSSTTNNSIKHYLIPSRNRNKSEIISNIFSKTTPIICLIFVSKISDINKIFIELSVKLDDVGVIHSDLTSRERETTLKRIKEGKYHYIICSDIASRGLDIEGVTHVINYDLPQDLTYFYHRVGRTGRAGLDGFSYTIYDNNDKQKLTTLFKNGIIFNHIDIKEDEIIELKPYLKTFKQSKEKKELNERIKKIKRNSSKVIKPGYKKKMLMEIEKEKQKYRRQIIKDDIAKRKKERAIERNRKLND